MANFEKILVIQTGTIAEFVLSLAAMGLFATINMNYGIDFKGGSMIEVQA